MFKLNKKKVNNPNDLPLEAPLKERFERISKSKCTDQSTLKDHGRFAFALLTEKPVYQPGERVQITLYPYHKWSKKPLDSLEDKLALNSFLVEVKDANDGKVATLSRKASESKNVCSYEFEMGDSFKGGFYKLEAQYKGSLVDSTKFFVTSVRDRRNAVTLDVNKDALTADDEVIGKVSLKMLTKGDGFFQKGAPGERLNYTVRVMDQGFRELEVLKKTLVEGSGMFSFFTPSLLSGLTSIIIVVEIFVEGEKLETSRQLSVKTLKDLFIRFVPDGGKYSLGFTNTVYFACFAGEDEKVTMALNNGCVFERDPGGLGMEEQVVSGVTSNEDGRGKFILKIRKNKEYVFIAKQGSKSKKFLVLGEKDFLSNSEDKMGVVNMTLNKKVFKWGETVLVQVQKAGSVMAKDFQLVLLDKLKVQTERLLKVEKEEAQISLNLTDISLENGGVFTLQLYKSGNTTEAIQETLIYVEPKERLRVDVSFDKTRYAPQDEVQLEVSIGSQTEGMVAISVSDETPFLEIEKRNYPVSLCSKVFLEKELHFKAKEWVNSVKYIDSFFENNPGVSQNHNAELDLECLLGVQDWRLFFLTEVKIKEYAKDPKKGLGSALRHLLGLSPETIEKILTPPPPAPRIQDMFFGGLAMARGN